MKKTIMTVLIGIVALATTFAASSGYVHAKSEGYYRFCDDSKPLHNDNWTISPISLFPKREVLEIYSDSCDPDTIYFFVFAHNHTKENIEWASKNILTEEDIADFLCSNLRYFNDKFDHLTARKWTIEKAFDMKEVWYIERY